MELMEESVEFYAESNEPIRLEGVLHAPASGATDAPFVILCHPHPIGGGSMDVGLIAILAQHLAAAGFRAFRFNFRGVGRSSGTSTGGVRETEDIQGVMRWLEERGGTPPSSVMLAGWSFGSWVGLRWAVETGIPSRIALVNPPLVGFDFFCFLAEDTPHPVMEKLIVHGERDQFSSREKIDELAGRLGAKTVTLAGTDHFLFGREEEVAAHVVEFFRE